MLADWSAILDCRLWPRSVKADEMTRVIGEMARYPSSETVTLYREATTSFGSLGETGVAWRTWRGTGGFWCEGQK